MCRIDGPFKNRNRWRVRVVDRDTGKSKSHIYATEAEAMKAIPRLRREYKRPVGVTVAKALERDRGSRRARSRWRRDEAEHHRGLRGTHAKLAVEVGISGDVVAASLGHESFAITAAHYAGHDAVASAAADRVVSVLQGVVPMFLSPLKER